MRRLPAPARAFTLVEMMVSMTASVVVLGALLLSSLSMQKALHGSEQYAGAFSDQHRMLDYIGRDLRRAVAIAATDANGARYPVTGGTVTIADRATLVLSLPGYYRSNAKSDANYDQTLAVVGTDERLDYGDATGLADPVEISFRKVYVANQNAVCFVRQEAGADQVIVQPADNLYVQVTIGDGGQSAEIKSWFRAAFSGQAPLVTSYDRLLLRNPLLDYHP